MDKLLWLNDDKEKKWVMKMENRIPLRPPAAVSPCLPSSTAPPITIHRFTYIKTLFGMR